MARTFHDPTPEHISRIAGEWCASYSGGKDSTALVTWLEWCRRAGWIDAPRPALVMSDTGLEHESLGAISADLMALLARHGWRCEVVKPLLHERIYNRILGVGITPIHPGVRKMRWCTNATKIRPMDRWRAKHAKGLTLTGLRMGESAMRDDKIRKASVGCAAGGECGIPQPSARTYSPIVNWRTCQVTDWIGGLVGRDVRDLMGDVFDITRRLIVAYDFAFATTIFDEREVVSAARFGCTGCPAIGATSEPPRVVVSRYGPGHPIGELYDVWFEARKPENRCYRAPRPGQGGKALFRKGCYGPIRLAARPVLFDRVMDIQRRAGVVLVTPEDEAFIRDCWARKVYPRGWSEADEAVAPPLPLFDGRGG